MTNRTKSRKPKIKIVLLEDYKNMRHPAGLYPFEMTQEETAISDKYKKKGYQTTIETNFSNGHRELVCYQHPTKPMIRHIFAPTRPSLVGIKYYSADVRQALAPYVRKGYRNAHIMTDYEDGTRLVYLCPIGKLPLVPVWIPPLFESKAASA